MKSRLWKHFHTKHTVDWKELTVKCYIDWLSMPRYLTKCWLVQWLRRVASSSQAPTFNDDGVCLLVGVALVHVQRVAGEGAEQQQQERGAGPHVDCGGAGRRLSGAPPPPATTAPHHSRLFQEPYIKNIKIVSQDCFHIVPHPSRCVLASVMAWYRPKNHVKNLTNSRYQFYLGSDNNKWDKMTAYNRESGKRCRTVECI